MVCGKIKQAYNKKTGAWVKFKVATNSSTGGKYAKIIDVKQQNPKLPFKGIKKV